MAVVRGSSPVAPFSTSISYPCVSTLINKEPAGGAGAAPAHRVARFSRFVYRRISIRGRRPGASGAWAGLLLLTEFAATLISIWPGALPRAAQGATTHRA